MVGRVMAAGPPRDRNGSRSRRRRRARAAWALVFVVSACLVGVGAPSTSAQAQGAGPSFSQATPFRSDGVLSSDPATVTLPSLGTAAFVVGTDASVWWSTASMAWNPLGAPPPGLIGNPAAVSWGPGRIDLFVEGGDHKLWQRWTACSGCQWSSWLQPVGTDGTLASSPAVTSWGPGRIDVIVQGTDGNYYWRDWDTSAWSGGWQIIGAPAVPAVAGEQAAVTTYGPGRLDVFVRGGDNKLWQWFMVNNVFSNGFSQPLGATGTLNSAPAADWWTAAGSDAVSVFVQGVDGRLYQATYEAGAWIPWTVEGLASNVFVGDPKVPTTLQFQPYVLVRGTDNKSYGFFPANPLAAQAQTAAAYTAQRAGFASFTLVDTATHTVYSSAGANTQVGTASVIKVPIAMSLIALADSQHRGLTGAESSDLAAMITQSDDNAATALWNEVGGSSPVLGMMRQLGATNTAPDPSNPQAWGLTLSTSHDLATVLAQLAQGAFAGANTIVNLMHQVTPSQAWGIGAAIPSAAIKNGWFPDPGDWRVNCLGIVAGTRYALAVTTQYPIGLGQGYGEATCQHVAAVLFSGPA